jgi:2-haloacid dehalogenase
MDFSRFTAISFDCYGTLVDWESGILPVLRKVLAQHGQTLTDFKILELYGEFEADAESGPYQSYRRVLQSVVRSFGDRLHFGPTTAEISSLDESVSSWRPFPDTVAALRALNKRHRLALISNIDDELFAVTRKYLQVDFDCVVTAEQAKSYKPAIRNFQMALGRLGIAPAALLHAGQSIYHDVVPAASLGIATAWVNRKSARAGIGAVRAVAGSGAMVRADIEVPDLASLSAIAIEGGQDQGAIER